MSVAFDLSLIFRGAPTRPKYERWRSRGAYKKRFQPEIYLRSFPGRPRARAAEPVPTATLAILDGPSQEWPPKETPGPDGPRWPCARACGAGPPARGAWRKRRPEISSRVEGEGEEEEETEEEETEEEEEKEGEEVVVEEEETAAVEEENVE